jgi:hypothetical protein
MVVSKEAEIAAVVVADLLLRLVPKGLRTSVLSEAAIDVSPDDLPLLTPDEIDRLARESSRLNYSEEIMLFKARVIATFVRDITNNHSPEDAARILFSRQPGVPGLGLLFDYLRRPLDVMNK